MKTRVKINICILALLFASGAALAQESRGAIAGQVTDPQGAVIPGVNVILTNTETGQVWKLVTNASGSYSAPLLSVGTYRLEVEHPGFKKYVRDRIAVRVADRLQVDIPLEVGALTESVTVTEGTPLIEAVDASLGQVIDARRVADLPIAHGNPYVLIALAPGSTFDGNPKLNRPFEPTHITAYSIAGTRNNTTDVLLDGVANTSVGTSGNLNIVAAAWVPPQDSMAEFKVQTSAFDAKMGQGSGAAVNISLKMGTNTPHGSAYWYKMTPEMMANDYFSNANRLAKTDFTYDRWGGSLNGPVVLPKLYNGHNKTFFMWAYEGLKESRPRPPGSTITVPTELWRQGNFSDLLALGATYQIYNPNTRRQEGTRFRSDPFSGNIIPPSLINPVAAKVLTYIPKPINDGTTVDHQNNFPTPNQPENLTYYSHVWRVDHNISDRNRFFVRANTHKKASEYNDWFESYASGNKQPFYSHGGQFDDIYMISPTMVLNLRYGYARYVRKTDPLRGRGFDLTTIGFPSALNNAIPAGLREFPYFNIRNGSSTMFSTLNIGEDKDMQTHAFVAQATKARGSHNFEFGHEYRAYRYDRYNLSTQSSGNFDFDETYTRGPLDNSSIAPMGQGLASLLLGLPDTRSNIARNASYAEQSTAAMFYFQDTWRATRKLNLTLGLRYELEGPLTERFNRSVRGFDGTAVQPNEAAAKAAYAKIYATTPTVELPPDKFTMRGGLTFAGVNGQPRTLWEKIYTNFMPRLGLAYSVNDKTVIRGGYGIFFTPLGIRRSDVYQNGFSRTTPLVVTDNNVTFKTNLSNPFPDGLLDPLGAGLGIQTDLNLAIPFFLPEPKAPYTQRWQFSVQRELLPQTMLEVAYVGNRGTHLWSEYATGAGTFNTVTNINAVPLQYLSTSPVRDAANIAHSNNYAANVPNPYQGLANMGALTTATTLARNRLFTPYPQFTTVTTIDNDGYSWYHSLQARLERRYAAGLTVNLGYTWSKFMEATVRLNAADPQPSEGLAAQDHTHRLLVSTIYEVPVGRKRKFLTNANAVVDGIVGGWQLQAIYILQSGAPLGWADTTMVTSGVTTTQRDPNRWFDTSAFVTSTTLQPQNHLRTWPFRFSTLRSDYGNNWDLSAIKKWRVTERLSVQFRGEFLNALNHPSFTAPTMDPYSKTFGQVSTTAGAPRTIQLGLKAAF